MLIIVIVLQVLILLVLCVIARRLPKQANVVNVAYTGTVGDVATLSQMRRTKGQSDWLKGERTAEHPGHVPPAEPEQA